MRASHFRLELYLVERRRDPLHAGHCVLAKGNTGFVSAHQHGLDVEAPPSTLRRRREKLAPVQAVLRAILTSSPKASISRRLSCESPPVDVEACESASD